MSLIRPITEFGTSGRVAIHGRIRTGHKVPGKKGLEPRALKNFRFTSTDLRALTILGGTYGGEPREWSDPKAAEQGGYELYTDANEIDVLMIPGGLSCHYEEWAGSGIQRRCDGITCDLQGQQAPCLCARNEEMVCKPKTRLNVVLPGIEFRGLWLFSSGSWAVAEEMSSIEPLVQQMQAKGILRAKLKIEQRSKISEGKKKNYIVTTLVMAATPEELASGQGSLRGIPVVTAGEIGSGETPSSPDPLSEGPEFPTASGHHSGPSVDDEDICDAELVETDYDRLVEIEAQLDELYDQIAATSNLDRDAIIRGISLSIPSSDETLGVSRVRAILDKATQLVSGEFELVRIDQSGRLIVRRATP